jgi:TolA-binding protein
VKFSSPITAFAACAAIALLPSSSAFAQRQPASPEQRIDRLEKQVEQIQRQVFPKGRPASTAGFSDDPAATQTAVVALDQRLNALERQMADMLRQSEENGNRLRSLEAGLTQVRADQEQRISALEARLAAGPVEPIGPSAQQPATPGPTGPKPAAPKPTGSSSKSTAASGGPALQSDEAETAAATDPGEDAYTEGFHLWEAGKYDDAINALRAFTSAYPKHRRVSFANNLVGRALLDKGQPRAAAEALLANYRSNPSGERAPDSLLYLGQALLQLGQPSQACKAYSELDAVYGAKIRPDLKKLETDAKAKAQCS